MVYFLIAKLETLGLSERILTDGRLSQQVYPILSVEMQLVDVEFEVCRRYRETVFLDSTKSYHYEQTAYDMHEQSGLLSASWEAAKTLVEIEQDIIQEFDFQHLNKDEDQVVLAGWSPQFDAAFLAAQMPTLYRYLHYWNFNLSTITILKTLKGETPPSLYQDTMDFDTPSCYAKTNRIVAEARALK